MVRYFCCLTIQTFVIWKKGHFVKIFRRWAYAISAIISRGKTELRWDLVVTGVPGCAISACTKTLVRESVGVQQSSRMGPWLPDEKGHPFNFGIKGDLRALYWTVYKILEFFVDTQPGEVRGLTPPSMAGSTTLKKAYHHDQMCQKRGQTLGMWQLFYWLININNCTIQQKKESNEIQKKMHPRDFCWIMHCVWSRRADNTQRHPIHVSKFKN